MSKKEDKKLIQAFEMARFFENKGFKNLPEGASGLEVSWD